MQHMGEYHYLYVQSDTIMQDIRKLQKQIHENIPAPSYALYISAWIIMAGILKKDKGKVRIINRLKHVINV